MVRSYFIFQPWDARDWLRTPTCPSLTEKGHCSVRNQPQIPILGTYKMLSGIKGSAVTIPKCLSCHCHSSHRLLRLDLSCRLGKSLCDSFVYACPSLLWASFFYHHSLRHLSLYQKIPIIVSYLTYNYISFSQQLNRLMQLTWCMSYLLPMLFCSTCLLRYTHFCE